MGVLDGKIAIVTGAGRGLGREIALYFAGGEEVDTDSPDWSPAQIAPVVTWLASEAGQDMT